MGFNKALEHMVSLLPPVAVPDSILPRKAEKITAKRGKSLMFLGYTYGIVLKIGQDCPRGEQTWRSHGLGRGRQLCE